MTLKIATLNIWNKSGPWAERKELIRKELAALAPDVLGLQEVLRLDVGEKRKLEPDEDQASEIAQGLGYQSAFAAAMHYGNGLMFGNALLSRHAIREQRAIPLPGHESGEARVLLYALIDTPHGPLPAYVTHLNWKLHHGQYRLLQVRAIVEAVFELSPIDEATLPPVLMGDFNAGPDSDEIRYLSGHATIEGRSVYFADAWLHGGEGPGYTFDRKNRFAALAHEPPRRIDYIFTRGPDRKFRGEALATRLCFAERVPHPSGDLWPSDHFGVVADIAASPRNE